MALSLRSCLSSLNSLCLLAERRVPRLIRANPRPSTTTETAPAKNRSRGEAEIVTPNAVNAIAVGELAKAITAKPVATAANRVSAKPSAITRKPPVLIGRVAIVTMSQTVMLPILWRFDCTTHDQAAPPLRVLTCENGRQQRDGSHLVQGFVAIAALGRLHARRAPFRALAGEDRVPRRGQPDPGRAEPSLGEPCASGMTVVAQNCREAGVRMQR